VQQLRFERSGPDDLFGLGEMRQCSDGVGGRMTLGDWAGGPDGRTAVGALGVLADEVLGYALMASLPQDAWSISTEIWIDVIGELPAPHAGVIGHACPVEAGSFSTGELRDGGGRTFALCRQRGRYAPRPAAGVAPVVAAAGPVGGLDALLGLRPDRGAFVLESRPDLANPNGMLHGGVSLAASEVVATRHRVESGSDLRTSAVHIAHTRGIPSGAEVVFRCEPRYAGRTLQITDVVGTVADKVCTVATVTAVP
jgi:acyl-coenzyme A thioesterase PaaI-like protein